MSAQSDSLQPELEPQDERIVHEQRIADRLTSATDDQLAAFLKPCEDRLRVVENYVQDQKDRLPGVERHLAAIRQNLENVRKQLERPAA